MAEAYYVEDFGALRFGSLVHLISQGVPGPVAYVLAGYIRARCLLGLPRRAKYAFGPPGSGRIVTRQDLPDRALARWAPLLEQLDDQGFRPLYCKLGDVIGAKESAGALFLDEAGSTFALLEWMRLEAAGVEEQTPLELDSFHQNDPETMTGMIAEEHLALANLIDIPFVDQVYVRDSLRLSRVYRRHQGRIRDRAPIVFTPEAAIREFEERNRRRFDWMLQAGFIRPLTPRAIERVRQRRLPV